jgi:hypothetical protein
VKELGSTFNLLVVLEAVVAEVAVVVVEVEALALELV